MAFIISHRGNNKDILKENTLNSLKKSLNKNYIDGVEFDIRITKDNKFVLSHSPIYSNGLIINNKLKDLSNLDELNYVLKNINTDKIILIDIKHELINYEVLIVKLNKILKKYKKLNLYLCSFNYDLVKELKEKFNYRVGLIISSVINKNRKYDIFDFIVLNYRIYKNNNKTTMLWTINKKEIIKKYINKNIFIITDKPYLVNEI